MEKNVKKNKIKKEKPEKPKITIERGRWFISFGGLPIMVKSEEKKSDY